MADSACTKYAPTVPERQLIFKNILTRYGFGVEYGFIFSPYGVDYLVKSVLLRFLNMTKNRIHRAHHPWNPWLKCPGEFSPRSAARWSHRGNTNGWGS